MIVVTVARRPLSEGSVAANVLKHGCGALHIDATRIGYGDGEVDFAKTQRQQAAGDEGAVAGAFGAGALVGTVIPTYKPGGRWPANLVLGHLPGCQQVGTREEPGYSINRFTDGMKPFGEGAGHSFETVPTPAMSVPVWVCTSDCPVADLDGQSGVTKSAVATEVKVSPMKGQFVANARSIPGVNQHGDMGGASRYFKQVRSP